MSKTIISDWKIKLIPNSKLIKIIIDLEKEYDEFPENILNLLKEQLDKPLKKSILKDDIKFHLSKSEIDLLHNEYSLNKEDYNNDFKNKSNDETSNVSLKKSCAEDVNFTTELKLELNDIKWLNNILIENRAKDESVPYLHEILNECKIILPENEVVPRNPVLEERCKKLKLQQENEEYKNITKNVDCVRKTLPEDTIAYQMKSINKQLIAVLQFIFSVVAGFAFGFIGVELIVGNLDFGFRLLLGIICALTIALAEIYFLAKKLNELDDAADVKSTRGMDNNTKLHSD